MWKFWRQALVTQLCFYFSIFSSGNFQAFPIIKAWIKSASNLDSFVADCGYFNVSANSSVSFSKARLAWASL
jgi:hypothetical protein